MFLLWNFSTDFLVYVTWNLIDTDIPIADCLFLCVSEVLTGNTDLSTQ